jgi:cell division protein FtsZ
VKSVMQGAGSALMGIGSARGEDRAIQAAETAISSPLLEASVDGAHGVLLSIQGGSDLGLFEINEAARLVQEAAHPEANIIFGAVIDDALGDEVRVTVIAAGFDGGAPVRRRDDRSLGQVSGRTVSPPTSSGPGQPAPALPQQPVSSPIPTAAHTGSYPISNSGGYSQTAANGSSNGSPAGNQHTSNGYGQAPSISAPVPPSPIREPEPDWRTAQERQDADRMERQPEPEAPPRMVELPDAGRPVRPARPVVLEDDDLDVPDFLK